MTWAVRAPATAKLGLVSRPGRRIRVSALGWGLLFSLRTKSPDVGGSCRSPASDRSDDHVRAARPPAFQLSRRGDHGRLQQRRRRGLALDELTLKKIRLADRRHVPLAKER